MQLDEALSEFLVSPVMIIIGTHDAALRADIGRGNGALVQGESGVVDLLVSGWLWPGTVSNLRTTGAVAATFARPRDYAAYQIKGRAMLIEPKEEHLRVAADYSEAIREALVAQGLEGRLIDPWLCERDLCVARITVAEAFEQTPGPRAGRALAGTT